MKNTIWMVCLIFIISIIPLISLLHVGLPLTHDGQDHVARIANFYQSLSEGNIIPRWAGNLNWGYGHPILMFLYPLPSYAASLFHVVGFSLVDSIKLVFSVSYIASVYAMYLFASTAWGPASGVISALLYGYAPYRFVDMYVRGAIGEHVAFVFPPLIFYGMLRMAKNHKEKKGKLIIALSTAGLILAHNAVALMVLPIVLLYGIYLFMYEAKNRLHFLLFVFLLLSIGFFLSAFFWIPAFFEGKYTLRDIVTQNDFATRFVPWQWFFVSPWSYGGGNEFSKEIGLMHLFSIFGSVIVLFKSKSKKLRILIIILLIVYFVSLFLMTDASQLVWNNISLLQKFQFPWRFLAVSVFVSSVLAAIAVVNISKKFVYISICLLVFITFLSTKHMWRAKDYLVKSKSFYTDIYAGTTDTGESSPIWSVRFMERRPNAQYEVIEGEAIITPGFRNTTRHEFIVSAKNNTRIVDNTLYFPGWTITLDGRPLDLVQELIYQDPNYRGLMTFRVPRGTSRIVVSFGDTKLRKVANTISILGFIAVIGIAFIQVKSTRKI